jgi:hypothetical protein
MKNVEKNNVFIENFLSSMDVSLPIMMNIANANYDVMLYKWDNKTFMRLINSIYQVYERKNKGKKVSTK